MKEECISHLRKLTEMITKDMVLVDDQILQKIYLLKCYCHYHTDPILANQSAKLAIELQRKVDEENSQLNLPEIDDSDSVLIHLNSQMLRINSSS